MRYAVVIGTQRSGTTVLRSLLGSHPEIATFGEVFLYRHAHMKECYYHFLRNEVQSDPDLVIPGPEASPALFDRFLEYLETLVPEGTGTIAFDCKYNFLDGSIVPGERHWGQPPFLLRQFRRRKFSIIHCVRRNALATIVSSHLTNKNKVWATNDLTRIKHTMATVPTDNLLNSLKHRKKEQDHYSELLGSPTFVAYYEDMFDRTQFSAAFLRDLSEHLGLENRFVAEPQLKKIAPPVSHAIENLNEIKSLLRETEFNWMLEDT